VSAGEVIEGQAANPEARLRCRACGWRGRLRSLRFKGGVGGCPLCLGAVEERPDPRDPKRRWKYA
jgi:hypothetical protein